MNRPACIAFRDVLQSADIARIRTLGDAAAAQEATVEDAEHSLRRSLIAWLPAGEWLGELLVGITRHINDEHYGFDLDLFDPGPFQYTVYTESGYYGWHMDLGPKQQGRKLSLTIQLSQPQEYAGGDFQARTGSEVITAPREQGAVIAFPSWIIHRVTPVTAGVRRSLVVWASGEPFR